MSAPDYPEYQTDTKTSWTPNQKVIAAAGVAVVVHAAAQFGLDLHPIVDSLVILAAAYLVPERS